MSQMKESNSPVCPSDDIQSSVDRQRPTSASQILMVLSRDPEIT